MSSPTGGDFNLGRAHGDIIITADTRGAQEAQAAMAATKAEAEVLDRQMGRVNETFRKNQSESVQSAEAISRHRQQAEDLRRTYQRYYDDLERAKVRAEAATRRLDQAMQNEATGVKELDRLRRDAERAKDAEERLTSRVTDAHVRYEQRLASVRNEVARFNEAHIAASSGLNQLRLNADRAGEAIESLSGKLSSVLRIVGQGGIMGLFGLGSAGTMSAGAAGGLSGLTSIMGGVLEMVQQLSGVVALLPAAVGGAAVALGTLATAFQGVGAAISSVGDPEKFIEALRNLAPAARQAMLVFASFQDAIRGVRFAIQEATFEPFVAQLQPLIYTWLPMLQNAGVQVGHAFGQMISQVMGFFQTAGAQQGFNTFIQNMVVGLQAASKAIQPLMSAFQTLAVVGSGFFERIGAAITTVANEFNQWVQGAANSGRLQQWINQALNGFTNLAHVALNLWEAINNIFSIGDRYGGGFIGLIRELSQEFVNWTRSSQGVQTIANFFDLLHQAGQAIHPILRLLGEGFDTIFQTLTRLGINIAPAVTQFFGSLVEALRALAPFVLQSGPAISQFLISFGQAILQVVQGAGPELPRLIKGMADAFIALLPVAVAVLHEITTLLNHFTPGEIQGIFIAALAIKTLSGAFGIFTALLSANPITLVIGALALLGAAAYEAYQHWQPFHDAVDTVWQALQGFAAWLPSLPGIISAALQPIDDFVTKALNWGSRFVENFAHGITSGIHWVAEAINNMMDLARGHLPSSRAKYGPFSSASPEELGQSTAQGYAAGLSSGTPAVAAASSGIAGSAAGTTGLGFSSAGTSGRSGSGLQGNSGFDNYVKFLTTDLQNWNNILSGAFKLAQDTISNVIVPTIRVAANLWGGGDNPLTRTGGFFGPQRAWGQQQVPGINNVEQPGRAPDEYGRQLGARSGQPGQQRVPGVQNVGPPNRPGVQGTGPAPAGPGSAGGAPTGTPPTQAGAAPPSAPAPAGGPPAPAPAGGAAGPTGMTPDQIAQEMISQGRAAGMNDQQIQAMIGVGLQETGLGTNPRTNVVQNQNGTPGIAGLLQQDSGYDRYGNKLDPRVAIRGFIDQYVHTGQGLQNPNPWDQALQVQRPARVGQGGYDDRGGPNSGSYLQGRQGAAAQDFFNRNAGGAPAQPARGLDWFAQELQRRREAPSPPAGGALGPAPLPANRGLSQNFNVDWAQGAGIPPLYQNPPGGGDPTVPGWVTDFLHQFGSSLKVNTTPHPGLHGAAGGPGYAIDVTGTQEDLDNFARTVASNPALASRFMQLIRTTASGEEIGIAGGQVSRGMPTGDYAASHYYGESGEGFPGHGGPQDPFGGPGHVHIAMSGAPPVNIPGFGAPPPPGATAPGAGGGGLSGEAQTGGGGGALFDRISSIAGLGIAGGFAAVGLPLVSRLAYSGIRGNAANASFEARYNLALFRNGGDVNAAIAEVAGVPPEGGPSIRGLGVNIGGEPTGGLRYGAFDTGLGPLQGPEVPPGFGAFEGPQLPGTGELGITPLRYNPLFRGPILPQQGQILGPGPLLRRVNPPASVAGQDAASVVGDAGAEATGGGGLTRALGIGGRVLGPALAVAGAAPYAWSVAQNLAQNQRVQDPRLGDLLSGRQGFQRGQEPQTGTGLQRSLPLPGGTPTGVSPTPTPVDPRGIPQSTIDLAARSGNLIPGTTPSFAAGGPPPAAVPTTGGTPGVRYGPNGEVVSAGPTRTAPPPATTTVPPANAQAVPRSAAPADPYAADRDRLYANQQPRPADTGRFGGRGNVGRIGAGIGAPAEGQVGPVKVDVTHQAGVPLQPPTTQAPQVALRDQSTPLGPPSTIAPGRFSGRTGTTGTPPANPPASVNNIPGADTATGQGQSISYKDVYDQSNMPATLPYNAKTPAEAFTKGMQDVGSIAGDAFKIFSDVIDNINKTADILDTLSRGPANTEDVVRMIQDFQSYLTTASDVFKLVGDIGGAAGGASGGMDMGAGAAIQAIAGVISSAITTVNEGITLAIETYHEVGKYAGFIIGEFLGGPNTGPLGGNVRMLLNTRTNQLQTYSEDNPLNKNTFNVPLWQRSYTQQPTPTPTLAQINYYAGPGDSPQQFMSNSMYMATTGSASSASVAGAS